MLFRSFDYQTFSIRDSLKNTFDKNALHKYISISHSSDMHSARKKAIHEDMKLSGVEFVGVKLDFERESIQEVLWKHKQSEKGEKIVNICMLLTGALGNFKQSDDILSRIAQSMDGEDKLLVSVLLTDKDQRDKMERDINICKFCSRSFNPPRKKIIGGLKNEFKSDHGSSHVGRRIDGW